MLKIITILFSVLGSSHLVTVKVLDQRLNVTDGGSATLQCTYTTTIDTTTDLNIQWTFHQANAQRNDQPTLCPSVDSSDESSQSHCLKTMYSTDKRGRCSWKNQIYYFESGQSYSLGSFKNRITAATSPNNATITISNMQPSDSGVYICEVNNPPDFQGNNQGLFFVSVLVEPSKPICAIHGTPESGHRVSLTCHSEQGNPAPTYTWSKLSDGVATQPLGQMDIISGNMKIGNLSQFEIGTYQCNASNSQGFSVCTVELSEGAHEGAIAGAVIGAVLAAVIIGTVVWFISSKRKGKSNKEKSAGTELQTKAKSDVKYQDVPTVEAAPVQAHAVEVQAEEPHEEGEEQEAVQNNTSVEA
ncbi:V-set and immunoglobulin domain-containing protein 1-like isoform X1 [Acipenser ruthenus]|uniref:V-set and immunoglobulin domain-containing protein 1-like isoform X1 n=1 Tax=Acipenser ruthenus TaxID=7906 RepID=UPI00145AA24B|nr:V-set and immunoglobulin domain-containing protein 1-like isoform X1 [Acipenser ruthenus]